MGKTKKKLSEKILNKKANNNQKSLNPFEVHINKQKYQVLGQKSKNDRGLPGISRAKAIKKRQHTILPEYQVKHKANKFVDKRIGEKNAYLSHEERTMARFTAERIKHYKKSIYNLADDEILTHKGQTLSEIEKFEDPRSDDSDVDEEGRKSSGNLNDDFVDAHFGGGILTKTGKEGAKSHKDLIDQLIAESKKRKAEQQKTKEETLELTEKLDTEWKDLLPLVTKSTKSNNDKEEINQKPDDYDKLMRELKFEARGHPTDRLKTEDEIAKEEKEQLEKLEQERLQRMKGVTDNQVNKTQHKSADDLDDNFNYESETEEVLTYDKEGKLKNNIPEEVENSEVNKEENSNEEDCDEDDSDAETENDNYSDLQDESDSDVEQIEKSSNKTAKLEIVTFQGIVTENKTKHDVKTNKETLTNKKEQKRKLENADTENKQVKLLKMEENLQTISTEMEKAQKELPYTYTLPESYESLQSLLENQPPEYQNVIIERMIKCNHPSLASENKAKLEKLFVYLLQHLNDIATENNYSSDNYLNNCFAILRNLTPHLYYLATLNPQNAGNSLLEVIEEKQNDYRKHPKDYPGIEVLVFFKLISCLFSTSDFTHKVVSPCFIFISQMLTTCQVHTRYDITYGLFLVTLFLEYTHLSKRYLPAVIIFLMGIIHMAIPKLIRIMKILPPFKSNATLLVLEEKSNSVVDKKLNKDDFMIKEIDEQFKIKVLYITIQFCIILQENWKDLSAEIVIFEPLINLLKKIPEEDYPEEVQIEIKKSLTKFEESKNNKKLQYLALAKQKPKALRLYEPNIVPVCEYRKAKPMSKEKAQQEKLLHKLKKETKGALREIRKDKSFLGRVKIKERIQSDIERKEKVKKIFAEASIQQSELNALDRKNKRK